MGWGEQRSHNKQHESSRQFAVTGFWHHTLEPPPSSSGVPSTE